MSVAVDTNILTYVLTGDEATGLAASLALGVAMQRGGALVVSAPVYAELLALPKWTRSDLDAFIMDTQIRVDWDVGQDCWCDAGLAFAAYARRRARQKRIDSPRRILADFIIGAHATEIGALLTADTSFFRTNFPKLQLYAIDN